jgi:hypothetical protein
MPGTGPYYWLPVPTDPGHHWVVYTSPDAGLDPDVGHTELWLGATPVMAWRNDSSCRIAKAYAPRSSSERQFITSPLVFDGVGHLRGLVAPYAGLVCGFGTSRFVLWPRRRGFATARYWVAFPIMISSSALFPAVYTSHQ